MSQFKIANYNVSGGFYVGNEKTEYLDREASDTIDHQLLNQLIDLIQKEDVDVICFQEIITTEEVHYLTEIQNRTNLKYYDFFELSECNLIKDTNCGLAIFSKYPMECVVKELFPNPNLSKTTSSGKTYYTYDKGYMVCNIQMGEKTISVLTHHGFPYRRFNSTPEDNKQVFHFFEDMIERYHPDIITGDFNAENFMDLMIKTANDYKKTIHDITTVDGKKFDEILIHTDVNYNSRIIPLLSDHYFVIDEIENI